MGLSSRLGARKHLVPLLHNVMKQQLTAAGWRNSQEYEKHVGSLPFKVMAI